MKTTLNPVHLPYDEKEAFHQSVKRVAVFRALHLGDMLCAVPALRALRAALPEAHITLIGLPWARRFAERFSAYLDGFISFPGHPDLPESTPDIAALPNFFDRMQAQRLDLAIQLHGSGVLTNSITALLGARHTAGFFTPGAWCLEREHFMTWPEQGHEIERLLCMMQFLGIPSLGKELEFPLTDADFAELRHNPVTAPLEAGAYACIHAGAQLPSRRWPPERFAAVADWLATQGLRIVLTGTADERPITRAVAGAMRAPALDLAGSTSLGGLAALVSGARLVICNDTGISHIAAARKIPSVVVCLGSDPERWAPLDGERHRLVVHPVACRPCSHRDCPIGHPCAEQLAPARVIEEAGALLAGRIGKKSETAPWNACAY
jgi:ADP-heptose:LPS heptosyltransferase